MVAAERQSRHDRHRGAERNDRALGQRIAHDLIVDLSVNSAPVHADARTTCAAALHGFTEPLIYVGLTGTGGVL